MSQSSPAPRRAHRARKALAASGLILLAALLTQPLWLGPVVSRYLTHTAGRLVHVGRVWLSVSPRLRVKLSLRDLRAANVAWAVTREPMAVVEAAEAEFAWRSLIERGPWLFATLDLRHTKLNLERQADGLRNWRLGRPENRGPGRFRALRIACVACDLRLIHRGNALDLRLTTQAATPADAGAGLPTRLDASGTYRGVPFAGSASTTGVLSFYQGTQVVPLRGSLRSGDAVLRFSGTVAGLIGGNRVNADLALEGTALAPLGRLFGLGGTVGGGYALAGHFEGGDGDYRVSRFEARVGRSDLAGTLRLGGSVRQRRFTATADLASRRVNADDFAGLARTPRAPPTPIGATRPAPTFSGQLRYRAQRVQVGAVPTVTDVQLEASAQAGRVQLQQLTLALAGGRVEGRGGFDLGAAGRDAQLTLRARGLDLRPLLAGRAAAGKVTGRLDGDAELRSDGRDLAGLARGLAGTAELRLSRGQLASRLDALLGLEIGKLFGTLFGKAETVPLTCARLALRAAKGRATVQALVIDTEGSHTTGTGRIDLADRRLDLVLTPEAREFSLLQLERSIRLSGPWQNLDRALIERAQPSAQRCKG